MVVVLIIINITVMSNFLGKFIEHIFQLSPFNQYYDFKDHVVIIGNLDEEKTRDLLEEIVETDLVERNMNLVTSLAMGIKVIIVLQEDPSSSFNLVTQYLSDLHDNEIVFLKENIFSPHRKWLKKANINEAKVVFAFSQDQMQQSNTYVMDQ